ncbi:hypothetical protein S140_66 [Shewanella sp. phage 1/40]|uniref:hypothetical protein n=1 Tax=Shewanella sp. phage 1/40 TaxID=1458860 RepID=UPI0004F891FE|nr:hypothetical protein S140_66 [Shewanella sp. phage 1/40]AHK11476.1 hypothetical protein S140_66 [Shewanella sp. phage 1/40]
MAKTKGLLKEYSFLKKDKKSHIYLIYHCSECSKDTELWPHGSIVGRKDRVKRGAYPCGCSKPNWKDWQYRVLIKRRCEELGKTLISINSEKELKSNTKLTLMCNIHKSTNTETVNSLLSRHVFGCKDCASSHRESNRESEAVWEDGLRCKYVFLSDKSCLNRGEGGVFSFFCPTCAGDFYGINGMCSGEFNTNIGALNAGRNPCRCNRKGHYMTYNQLLFKLDFILKSNGCTGINYNEAVESFGSVSYVCKDGHINKRTVNSIINGHICNWSCYNLHKLDVSFKTSDIKDVLYLIRISVQGKVYLKIGRTINLKARIKNIEYSGYVLEKILISQEMPRLLSACLEHLVVEGVRAKHYSTVIPEVPFKGKGECFNDGDEFFIIEEIKRIKISKLSQYSRMILAELREVTQ